ncbi:supervillin-like [Pogonomyrmex barbatus]|uniref:Supervillin-like n=1 Tax=Pogonomyrmex barbatus TaxID=144034 RepID=A0A6I9WS25_9HYME|nr:supervillin-like [Pogonomyrmex barbatus]
MVAAGATVLMAASEENSSNETGNGTSRSINQSTCSRYSEIQRCGQRNVESSVKGDVATCSLNTTEKKQRTPTTDKNVKSKAESKESSKNFAFCKTAPIRETKTSRLRAASIVLSNDITSPSKKLLGSETSDSQRHNSSVKHKNCTSFDGVTMNSVKERDKSYKRKSYLNRSHHVETASVDHLSEVESSEKQSRRQYVKRSQLSETVSNSADSYRQVASLRRKHIDSKAGTQYSITKNLSKTYSSSSVVPITNTKRSIVQQSSSGIGDSEVSRRVDELTALTRATMERVERLASATTSCANHTTEDVRIVAEKALVSPKKCITSRHTPVSILKHKAIEGEGGDRQISSGGSPHASSPVTFSPSVTEPVSRKKHGILKKRSSLDESEILRRRSCSPDVSFADNIYSDFRPILKNQRRSSLDEIVKRDQSPDQQPASILKRKSSREDDREIHRSSLGSPEPQSILKRKLANSVRANSVSLHVTIASDLVSTNASGNTIAKVNTTLGSENFEGSEVRPILKKKYGKEEFAGGDISSHEPRPILKKKSSTESDEHEHDRPKKTILKSSRKNSYEEGGYETETTSPRKLSVLKNRASEIEIENVRPILKQSSGSRYHDDAHDLTADSFLRKRAQSVSHARSANGDDCIESIRVLAKRRSLESSSPIDVLHTPATTRRCFMTERSSEISYAANSSGVIKDSKLSCEGSSKIKQVDMNDMEEKSKTDSHINFMKIDDDRDAIEILTRMNDKKKETVEEEKRQNAQGVYEDCVAVCRSNSVSKMTQHFKVLQERANAAAAENNSQYIPPQRLSRGIQRYRERKVQSGERFNTQPVTFQEVREAVLQNQRNAATSNAGTTDNEPEPSKLSLTERVRLFNQKFANAEIAATGTEYQEKFTQKRRQSTRYKTQPVTSEEVEVASRISPLNINQIQMSVEGRLKENQRPLHSFATTSQYDVPKSILKSSTAYTQNLLCAKSPELRGIKLIKSVLKRESEESEQPTILPNSEVHPRSILKSNSYSRPVQTTSVVDAAISRSERSLHSVESQNLCSETAKFCEKFNCFNIATNMTRNSLRDPCYEIRTIASKQSDMENEAAVPSHKAVLFQNEEILSVDADNCKIDTIGSSSTLGRRSDERHNNSLVDKPNRVSNTNDDNNDDDNKNDKSNDENNDEDNEKLMAKVKVKVKQDNGEDDHASSSDSHEIRNTNEKHSNVAQCSINLLAKSVSQHSLSDERWKQRGVPLPGLCRSATQVIASIETNETPSVSIADRLAALRHSGSTNWKRRVAGVKTDESCDDSSLNLEENMTVKSGALADCIEKLESAVENWKTRIVTPDAINFTVAGKMKIAPTKDASSPFFTEATASGSNQKKKVPRPQCFKMRNDNESDNDVISTPTSPCKDLSSAMRTSFSEPVSDDSGEECKTEHGLSPSVSVPKMDDETFTSFFSGVSLEKCETECLDLDESDFDIITPQSELLVQKRNIRTQRRRVTSKNPLKVLAARTDIRSEYTEIRTDIAARTIQSLNIGNFVKNSSFAIEALAGLASTEDFSTVTLRNVSEKTRAAEIALSIQQQKDLGCQATQVITINEDKPACTRNQIQKFWSYLGVVDSERLNIVEAGHPDEDELYESAIIDTNMVYELKDEQLVSYEKFWGTLPKIEMLDKNKILVFDFGTEMYIWSGKGISTDRKKLATQLATKMWNNGYDYSECTACPINAARMIGSRNDDSRTSPMAKSAKNRPEWCLLAKLTQHVETILFREKFLDWPNVTNAIKTRGRNDARQIDGAVNVQLDENDDMWLPNSISVDLILEGCHLGRGTGYYDNELKKEYVVATTSIMIWHIDEFSHTLLDGSSIGQFYSGDSYIVQWTYSVTITGRELGGLPSKHSAKGRDRFVYFIWQGRNASLSERGAAALLTVELDNDRGPQVRVNKIIINLLDGRNPGEVLIVENELARLTQSTYPPAQLLQRPLPDGVDPTRLELYLSQQHFQELLGMSKEEFQQLPVWKQVNLKKDIGLF